MILKPLIVEAVVNYFKNEITWKLMMNNLVRGKEFLHGHVYVDSILHPESLGKVIEGYLETHGLHLLRKTHLMPSESTKGTIMVYNIHPQDTTHFEVGVRYNEERVLAPTSPSLKANKRTVEIWDKDWNERGYAQNNWKTTLTAKAEKDLTAIFNTPEWESLCRFLHDEEGLHAHLVLETSIHPEIIQEFGAKAIEAKGWEFSRGTHFPFFSRQDLGIIMLVVKKPELFFEIEWHFNPDANVKLTAEPITHKIAPADVAPAMSGFEYIELDDDAVEEIIELCMPK